MRLVLATLVLFAVPQRAQAKGGAAKEEPRMVFASHDGLLLAIREGLTDAEADRALFFMTGQRATIEDAAREDARLYFRKGVRQAQARMLAILDRAEKDGRASYHDPRRQRRTDTVRTWYQLNRFLASHGLPVIHGRYVRDQGLEGYRGAFYLPKVAKVFEERRSRGPALRLMQARPDLQRF